MNKITFQILLFGSFAICSAQDNKLIGNWEYSSNGQTSHLQIVSQNELIFNNERTTYVLVKNAIRVTDEYGYFFDYQYVLQNGQLLLTFPDGYQYPFKKAEGTPQNSGNKTEASNSTRNLYGNFCSFSGSSGGGSSYSSTRSVYFDGNGRFTYSTDASYSGSNGGYYNNDANAITGRCTVAGNTINLYLDEGGTETMVISLVQESGEITELQYGDYYFGKSLCE